MTTGRCPARRSSSDGARFDDLLAGEAMEFPAPQQVLEAHSVDEVSGVLDEVHEQSSRGRWAFGFVAYEAAAGLGDALPVAVDGDPSAPDAGLPLAWFGLGAAPRTPPVVRTVASAQRDYAVTTWEPSWDARAYGDRVAQVRRAIAAGDTYQCNLTMRLRADVRGDLRQLYADLAHRQRGRYAAYLDLGSHAVISASPELFFEWSGTDIRSRPMKGTARRGRTCRDDAEALAALTASDKERAENVIIADLVRNDLGRLADVGTVAVSELCVPERYETVWQLVSEVTATVAPHTRLLDIFRALFPAASVTGAPKRRTMQLIRDLEQQPRGVYCGAIGVVAPPDTAFRARFSVAIRTVVTDAATGGAVYGTGGGITWSSQPHAEHEELLAKAAILEPAAGRRA